ncbi:tyrosine-type recombinase/integrase [Hymenobacter cheonanensis]|uniref:tyrosine-type recombinase/integrase n=1 Tax=Hymenobacter sp. CA2-7 TaxID=3063993 RepID=UPI002713EE8E|nr:site-specific integrase [Hymenobacter sp. CA2-7]MDO7887603.1 site-specific integrase [Hymenobacter sp. CA2-7]
MDLFDRSTALTNSEKTALTAWVEVWNLPYISRLKVEQPLQRLIQPLLAALEHFGYRNKLQVQRTTVAYVLLAMYQRQTSFWSWGEQEWLELVGGTAKDYKECGHNKKIAVRHTLLACAYLLYNRNILIKVAEFNPQMFARAMFGDEPVQHAITSVQTEAARLGLGKCIIKTHLPTLICEAILLNHNPILNDLSMPVLHQLQEKRQGAARRACSPLSRVLHNLHIVPRSLKRIDGPYKVQVGVDDNIPAEWLFWIQRWHATSTNALITRNHVRIMVAKAGRWFAATYPSCDSPAQWTRDVSIAYVAAVDRMTVGEWGHENSPLAEWKKGKPLTPNGKAIILGAIRAFFIDCQDWGWLPVTFNPRRDLALPRNIARMRGPAPRVIADDYWAKLMHAGLNLTKADMPQLSANGFRYTSSGLHESWYPFELVYAITMVWLFGGLRVNEIQRLRLGCTRLQTPAQGDLSIAPESVKMVCYLDVPTGKSATASSKPVDPLVGAAVQAWEKIRPITVKECDAKTGEVVDFLFVWRGKRVSPGYLNGAIIPMLCKKAGVPESDTRGRISSHRARATIASQLYNAPEGMTLFELQKWLCHSSPSATQHYTKISPTKMAKAYSDADYFGRNVRTVPVTVNPDAITSGTANGEPAFLYDLGHGFCTLTLFHECKHRMACARCSSYIPKESSRAQMIEAKQNLLHFQQSISLLPQEMAAVVEGDIAEFDKLIASLQDTPTPEGPTPNELKNRR